MSFIHFPDPALSDSFRTTFGFDIVLKPSINYTGFFFFSVFPLVFCFVTLECQLVAIARCHIN